MQKTDITNINWLAVLSSRIGPICWMQNGKFWETTSDTFVTSYIPIFHGKIPQSSLGKTIRLWGNMGKPNLSHINLKHVETC